jgi:serine/threonine-protein kinase
MNPNMAPIQSVVLKDGGQKIGKYILTKQLGEGQFGVVWKAIHIETKELFAVKQIRRNKVDKIPKLKQLLNTEVSIMHQLNHLNILHLYDFFVSKNN